MDSNEHNDDDVVALDAPNNSTSKKKSGPGICKFKDEWVQFTIDGISNSEWLRKDEKDDKKAFCTSCNKSFSVVRGYYLVTQHAGTAEKLLRSGRNQSVFTSSSCGTLEVSHKKAVFTATEQQIFAEGLFAANHEVQSFNSVENVANLFRVMFPDSKIAEEFTLQRTKLTYLVTHGLAKHFKTSLIDDIKHFSSGFSVMFDETTTQQVKKHLDVYISYFSPTTKVVEHAYLSINMKI